MPEDKHPDRGLGDTIKRATTALGIRPCEPCRQRAERLNRLFPYKQPKPEQAQPLVPADIRRDSDKR